MSRPIINKQYARDMLRAVSEGQKARNPGVTDVKNLKTAKKQSSKSSARKGAKKALKARKAAKAPRARKASTAKARTPIIAAVGGKSAVVQVIADMMARPVGHKEAPLGGASMDEMVKATGYQPHPMRAKIKLVRDRLKYTTTAPSKANGYRYFAEPPKAETK